MNTPSPFSFQPYQPQLSAEWDQFVNSARNATFLLRRTFMDYHADRFEDASIICKIDKQWIALLPANRTTDQRITSHQGITYGGLLLAPSLYGDQVLHLFQELCRHLATIGYRELYYKPIPLIYHSQPSQDDLYAITRCGGQLTARMLSATIAIDHPQRISTLRRRMSRKAQSHGVQIETNSTIRPFWELLETNLSLNHQTTPVHTCDEMQQLMKQNTEIHHHAAYHSGQILAGVIVFATPYCTHIQYIAASTTGKQYGALDLLLFHLIENTYPHVPYFDFGISTEQQGNHLNESLLRQKEGFGARGTLYDHYLIPLSI